MVDYHTHSRYSDGIHSYREIVQSAQNKGIKELGFSDHLCLHFPEWAMQEDHFEEVKFDISEIKKENTSVRIKFGLEVDYIEGYEKEITEYINQFPVDYIIGSVHYVNNWNFDTNPNDYQSVVIDQFYKDYFRLIQKAALSGLFDIMGHVDVAKKFNYYPSFDLGAFYRQTAEIFAKSGVVVELNTSGLDKPCREFYPGDHFLKECFLQNVPITLGSDAHSAHEVARYFNKARAKLKQVGYRKIAVFNKRKKSFTEI